MLQKQDQNCIWSIKIEGICIINIQTIKNTFEVSKEEFIDEILNHEGFFINIGDHMIADDKKVHSVKLYSTYYQKAKLIGNWLSFYDHDLTNEELYQGCDDIEKVGKFELDLSQIDFIFQLGAEQRKPLFELQLDKVYYMRTLEDCNDICIGFIDIQE